VKVLVILEGLVQFGIGLRQRYIQHGDECLLDTGDTVHKRGRKVGARERFENGGEKGGVQLADVGNGDSR